MAAFYQSDPARILTRLLADVTGAGSPEVAPDQHVQERH